MMSANPSDLDPPGLNLQRLTAFLDEVHPGLVAGLLRAEVIAGGKSNITYLLSDGTGRWVVRRPPLGHVLATAHDMGREYRVMSALADTAVPLPRMIAMCHDPSLMGEPFYVMEFVSGVAYRQAAQLRELEPERVAQLSQSMVDVLLDLHAVDPTEVGLADFGRPAGFLERQIRRWSQQLDASATRELPQAQELARMLSADVPTEGPPAIVHGDYRLDNLLVDPDGQIVAVVDWEMATIGDPLTDVALLCTYMQLARQSNAIADSMAAPGFMTPDEALAHYVSRSPRDTSRMGFYLGLASFKLAVILEGIHRRFIEGKTLGEGFGDVGASVEPLLEQGISAMKEHG